MAHPWHNLPNNPDTADTFFNVVIEIPKVLENNEVKVADPQGHTDAVVCLKAAFTLYRAEENRLRGW